MVDMIGLKFFSADPTSHLYESGLAGFVGKSDLDGQRRVRKADRDLRSLSRNKGRGSK